MSANSIVEPEDQTPRPPEKSRPSGTRLTVSLWAIVTVVLLWSRLADRPHYLFYFDNANFALSIDRFDPRLHQPQPPGYPVFVALLKALHMFVHDPNHILILAGLLGSAAGLVSIWLWANGMSGRNAAWAATALLLLHPVFWTAGVANPVRTFLVVIAGFTAVFSWAAMTRPAWRAWFYVMSVVLGLLSGFRPESLLLLFPLWITTGIFRRAGARTWLAASALLSLAALVWIAPLVSHTGGIQSTWQTMFQYLDENSKGETAAFGATLSAALATAGRAARWNFLLTIAWIWAVPFVWRSLSQTWSRAHSLLLLGSFLPSFLFHAFIHVRDVDQTLISIPALCVIGGAALAQLCSLPARLSALAVALLISGAMFYRPPLFDDMAPVTHRDIRAHNDLTRDTFDALEPYRSNRDAIFVWDDVDVTWRQVYYYFPATRLLRLRGDPYWFTAREEGTPASVENGAILIPPVHTLVVGSDSQADELANLPGAQRRGPLVILPFGPGVEVKMAGKILRGAPR
jgi:hypothetical protein